jgi:hypothetical protein
MFPHETSCLGAPALHARKLAGAALASLFHMK